MAQGKTVTKIRQVRRRRDPETGDWQTVERTTLTRGGNVSEQAKANRARAGAANLAKWRAEQAANPDTAVSTLVAAFRASVEADTGAAPSASAHIQIEVAVAAFTSQQLCLRRLQRSHISSAERRELNREIRAQQKLLLRSSKDLAEMRTANADASVNAEFDQIEREIAAKRTEVKPS